MRLKIRIDHIDSSHVHCTFFSDNSVTNDKTFANLGKLIMDIGEYQLFGCALGLGAERMKGRFILEPEDPKFKEWSEKEANKEV